MKYGKIKLKTTIPPFGLKCGMKTGYSIVGSIPTEEREEFTAIGSSGRLEGRATGNQIIVSSHTRERIQNQFNVKPITVKVGEEIKAFEYERKYYEVLSKVIWKMSNHL